MDNNPLHIDAIRNQAIYWRHDLTAECAFITAENIDDLLVRHGFARGIAVLSIDIDGNDYWIWERVSSVSPDIVICEYNAVLGDRFPLVVPYRADFNRFDDHCSGLYCGASITALQHLAERKGYRFIGTNSNGVNAFFVRGDLADVLDVCLQERRAYPSRLRESRDDSGQLSYMRALERVNIVRDLPVIDIDKGQEVTLASLGPLYSDDWLAQMGEV